MDTEHTVSQAIDAAWEAIGGNQRLSDELKKDAHPYYCSRCGARKTVLELGRYRYLDRTDGERPINLCEACNVLLSDSDPRFDVELFPLIDHEPIPGLDVVCSLCVSRRGLRCKSPLAKANGGPGVHFQGSVATVHRILVRNPGGHGKRAETIRRFTPATSCDGRRQKGWL